MSKEKQKIEISFKSETELTEILSGLKEKNPDKKIYRIGVPVGGQKANIFLKDLDRFTYKAGKKVLDSDDELRGIEVFLKGMYLGGDDLELVLKDWRAVVSAGRQLSKLLKVDESDFSEV